MMTPNIDPFHYGQLTEKVNALEAKVDSLQSSMSQLLELANKSKGGLWAGMIVVSAVSGLISFASGWFLNR
jgi:hypothetical protein